LGPALSDRAQVRAAGRGATAPGEQRRDRARRRPAEVLAHPVPSACAIGVKRCALAPPPDPAGCSILGAGSATEVGIADMADVVLGVTRRPRDRAESDSPTTKVHPAGRRGCPAHHRSRRAMESILCVFGVGSCFT
jgi:hypothetical protein